MAKVAWCLDHGTPNPPRSPEYFRRKFGGGTFYPIRIDDGCRIQVPLGC